MLQIHIGEQSKRLPVRLDYKKDLDKKLWVQISEAEAQVVAQEVNRVRAESQGNWGTAALQGRQV
jgi:hypothetical protein